VKRIEAYGVFVALQGYRKYGLVHASQVWFGCLLMCNQHFV
jgi:predicted RNA-binding protein with RPS1 domain